MIAKSKFQKIYYEGPIDQSLFWPNDASKELTILDWRSVVELTIRFDMASLSGQWFFKGLLDDKFYDKSSDEPLPHNTAGLFPPGNGTEEDDSGALALLESMKPHTDKEGFGIDDFDFRRIPRDEAMIPMLKALAHRLRNTLSLKIAYLETSLPHGHGKWFFSYGAPGVECGFENYMAEADLGSLRARVFFHTED
ncbi:hypothetical protein OCU04_000671 [Sclerotinia nivalis]|uniref:Uncharacterized protein n=1 Tax=Sclerotinia nivalis TaxID=352851 RepID=A0A9X0AWL8_9HELO|nr:hypothetical protein OCU04_000671 [Sclerotinia nivalis]